MRFQRSGSIDTLAVALDKLSTPSCTVACKAMLRWANSASTCASALSMRQTLSLSRRVSLPSMPRHHTSAAGP